MYFWPVVYYSDISNRLFNYLVEVLGPNDFCAPVCMLLVERVAKQVSKRGASDVSSQLALPLSVLETLPVEGRLKVRLPFSSLRK